METVNAPPRRLVGAFIVTAFVTFVVLMRITFPNLGGTGLRMPFNATVWMGFALLMALAMWPASRGVIRYSAFHKGLGLLLLALWLPFLWSWNEASLIALPRMLTVTAGAILLLGLAQLQLTSRDWWWIGMAILAGALLETALSYAQLYLLEPGNWLGYDVERRQPYGIFQQRNVLASFLVTGLAVSAWLIGAARQRWERAIPLLAPLFMPAILWFNGSMTGLLAAVIVIPLLLLHLRSAERRAFALWGGALLGGVLLAALLWSLEGSGGVPRTAESIGGNTSARWYVYTHSLKMILEQPLTGWGYGRFQHDFLHSFADWRAAQPINQPEIVEPYLRSVFSHPHNELLLWGVEGGLLPFLVLASFGGWLLWWLWAHGPRGQRLLLSALLLPLTLHAMTELPFYQSLASWLVFILLLGMAAQACWPSRERENRYTFGIRVGGWLAVPVLIVFMGTHLHTLWQVKAHVESGGQQAGTLTSVVNPFGIPLTLDYLVMTQQLQAAANLGIGGMIEDYIVWGEKYAQLEPHPALYSNLVLAHYLLNREMDVQTSDTAQHAQHLFTTTRFDLNSLFTLIQDNSSSTIEKYTE